MNVLLVLLDDGKDLPMRTRVSSVRSLLVLKGSSVMAAKRPNSATLPVRVLPHGLTRILSSFPLRIFMARPPPCITIEVKLHPSVTIETDTCRAEQTTLEDGVP